MLAILLSWLLVALKALGLLVVALFVLALDVPKRWKLRRIPGPPALPFLGNLPQVIKQGSPTFFRECRAKYGPVFKVAFGRAWLVVVAEPELLRQVGGKLLNHALFRTLMRGEFQRVDQSGLLEARDDYWRMVRAAWQPAFSAASLASYLPRMVDCAGKLADRLEGMAERAEGKASGEVPRVDIWRELGGMTLQVVGSTAYGVDFQAIESEQPQGAVWKGGNSTAADSGGTGGGHDQYGRVLVEACQDFFRYSSIMYGTKYSRVSLLFPELRPLVSLVAHTLPDRPFAKLLAARRTLRDAGLSLISSWRAASAPSKASTNGASEPDNVGPDASGSPGGPPPTSGGVAPGSFLSLILSARDKATGEGLTDLQVAGQVQTFILAGYETTANALAFAVYCLANNPEAEARMLEEIDSVLSGDRLPTEADLPRLVYTEAVFNEAVRLYPPAHATNRLVDKGPIQVGDVTVPPGVPIFMSIFSAHHNPDVWPRVGEFIPERFLPSSPLHAEVCARVPNAHAPFGYGSRLCVGWKFAIQEAKVALATLYRRLRFELEPGQVPLKTAVGITLSPKHGVWVRPVPRRQPPVQRS